MIDLFSSYLKVDENQEDSNQSEDANLSDKHYDTNYYNDWISNPDFFFNKNRPKFLIQSSKDSKEVNSNFKDMLNNGLKDERLANNSKFLTSKMSQEATNKDLPKKTPMEKISPAYRLIKEAFTELQLFSRVCKFF